MSGQNLNSPNEQRFSDLKGVINRVEEYKDEIDVSEFIKENYSYECCTCTVCAQCGYRFYEGDDVVSVKQTGDVVHRECFTDYAEDSINELCDTLYF